MTLAPTSELTLEALKEGRALDPAEYALIEEGLLLSQLPNHPHKVGFEGIVIDDKGVMLVMEFIPGTTAEVLYVENAQERGKKSWASLVQICVEVASALEFLHSQDPPVLHVDVAARNVLIDAAGMTRIADFGLARRYTAASGAGGVGAALESGTRGEELPLRIVAPEVLNDAVRSFSRASDTYAFGMLMYEVLVGATPWGRGADPLIIARLAVRGARPPLPPPPLLDIDLRSLIEECWRHDPAMRPLLREVRWRLQELLDRHTADPSFQEPVGAAASAAGQYACHVAAATLVVETVESNLRRRASRNGGPPSEYY